MKRLKVKTIKHEFPLQGLNKDSFVEKFDDKVNEFLITLDSEKIYQISYLNSSATNSVTIGLSPKRY